MKSLGGGLGGGSMEEPPAPPYSTPIDVVTKWMKL